MSPRRVDTRWRRWRLRVVVVVLLVAGAWAFGVIASAILDQLVSLP